MRSQLKSFVRHAIETFWLCTLEDPHGILEEAVISLTVVMLEVLLVDYHFNMMEKLTTSV